MNQKYNNTVCSKCRGLLALRTAAYTGKVYHFSDMPSLVKSTENCDLCKMLLDSLSEEDKKAIMKSVNAGSYSKLQVRSGWAYGTEKPLYSLSPENAMWLKVATRDRYFYSRGEILLLPPESYLNRRAIWHSEAQIEFDRRVPVIHEWMRECLEKHHICRSPSGPYLPSRIIDIGSTGATHVRLVETGDPGLQSIPNITYATLSHRWGSSNPSATLTVENRAQWLQSLELAALPKTFRDAIEITRKLNIPFIWIDCMCIIQNDEGHRDWEREAVRMADIYRHSHLTIAPAFSADCHGGFSIDNALQPLIRKFTINSDSGRREVIIRPRFDQKCVLDDSPLHARGWIFQEQILSRRTVYFTNEQFFWQCRTHFCSEDGLRDRTRWCRETTSLTQYTLEGDDSDPDVVWQQWINKYSTREFTYSKDRISALAGITRFYQEATGDTPVAGLWLRNFQRHLLWSGLTQPSQWDEYRIEDGIPSWSWLSVDRGVEFRDGLNFYPNYAEVYSTENHTTLQAHSIEWSGVPLSSQLLKATITLCGPIMEMKNLLHLNTHYCDAASEDYHRCYHDLVRLDELPEPVRTKISLQLKKRGWCSISLDRIIPATMPIFGLLVRTVRMSDPLEQILLLTPVDSSQTRFRRIGYMGHTHKWLFNSNVRSVQDLSGPTAPPDRNHLSCFEGVEKKSIELV